MNVEQSSTSPPERSIVQKHGSISTSDNMPHLHSGHHHKTSVDCPGVISSAVNETVLLQRKHSGNTAEPKSVKGIISTATYDRKQRLGNVAQLSDQLHGPILSITMIVVSFSWPSTAYFS